MACLPLFCGAQQRSLHFEAFTMRNGLSENRITWLHKDETGFLWAGTQNGLNRFDGRTFKHYFQRPNDSTSISNQFIVQIAEGNGSIWCSTFNGLNEYHPKQGHFVRHLDYPNHLPSAEGAHVVVFAEATDGSIWLTNFMGKLFHYFPKKRKSVEVQLPDVSSTPGLTAAAKSFGQIATGIALQGDSICWVGTYFGLFRYQVRSKHFDFYPQPTNSFGTYVHLLPDGQPLLTVWEEGLFRLSPTTMKLERFYPKMPDRPDDIVWEILPLGNDRYWLACEGGLFELDRPGTVPHRIPLPVDGTTPTRASCFFKEKNGTIWIGTENGLVKFDPYLQGFQNVQIRRDSQQVYENDIYDVRQIAGRIFAVSRHLNGFYLIDNQQIEFHAMPERDPSRLFQDSKGRWWLTTWNGLYRFDPTTLKLTSANPPPRRENRKGANWALDEDPQGRIWCCTSRDGIFIHDPEPGKSEYLDCETDSFCVLTVRDVCIDRKNRKAWVSTLSDGLWEYDFASGKWRNFNQKNCRWLPSDNVDVMVQDDDGYLWMNTWGGACRYDWRQPMEKAFMTLTVDDGLPVNYINGFAKDKNGDLWTSTAGKFIRIDPKTLIINVFDQRHTKDISPFPMAQLSVWPTGEIAAGGKGSFLVWHPDSLRLPPPSDNLLLTDVEVLGKKFATETPFEFLQEIRLDHRENVLALHFTSLNFTLPEDDRFAWMLVNHDKDWVQGGSLRTAQYAQLPPGNYVFKVKASNGEGGWGAEKTLLKVVIVPAFWQTLAFKIVVFAALAMAAWALYRWRIRQIKEREEMKTAFQKRIAEVEMSALRAQMNPHFVFNCLNSINSYIQLSDPDTASGYLTKFSRLIRLVLDNSREEMVPLEKELEALRLYVELEALRFEGRFRFEINLDENLDTTGLDIPPMLIQPYVENAIWHGLMHRPGNDGHLWVRVREEEGRSLVFEVEDNGVGRAEAARLKSKTATHRKSHGMALTKERLDIIRQVYQSDITVQVEDLVLPDGTAGGTKVVLRMVV